jgi:hypothetical protein
MRDMNDMYVNDYCQTRIHIGGYVFTVAELYANAVIHMSPEELERHEDRENV